MQKRCIKISSSAEFEIGGRLEKGAKPFHQLPMPWSISDSPHLHDYQMQITLKEADNFSNCTI